MLCALVLLLGACVATEARSPVPQSTVPVISVKGQTNVFGLLLNIDPRVWKQSAANSTSTELWMEYSDDGQICNGQCPSLLIATAASQYYRLSTLRDGTVFKTETECESGASAFAAAEEREPGIMVAGRPVQYFVNPRCTAFQQPTDGSKERHTWFLPGEGMLIQLLPGTSTTVLGRTSAMLQQAEWS